MLKRVAISGAPIERGRQLGEELANLVRETWRFYREVVFPTTPFDLRACAGNVGVPVEQMVVSDLELESISPVSGPPVRLSAAATLERSGRGVVREGTRTIDRLP